MEAPKIYFKKEYNYNAIEENWNHKWSNDLNPSVLIILEISATTFDGRAFAIDIER